MVVRGKEFAEIHDLVGLRVIVESEKDCWAALGSIHAIWSPVQGRFKDYINSPKFNLYQSLHTTVIGPRASPSRSRSAPTRCTGGPSTASPRTGATRSKAAPAAEMAWLQRIVDWQQETIDPARVPRDPEARPRAGRGLRLHARRQGHCPGGGRDPHRLRLLHPHRGGHRCIGAKVNGRLVPLDTALQSADTVEIITSKVPSARAVARLAPDRGFAPGPQQDPAVVLAGSAARTPWRPGARSSSRRCGARACPCRSWPPPTPCSAWRRP